MSQKTSAQIISDANLYLPDNNTEEISAQDQRERIIDIADSYLNFLDYFSGTTTDYVAGDGSIQSLTAILNNYINQGSNTLTEALFLDGGGLYDLTMIDSNIDLNGNYLIDPSLIRYSGSTFIDVPNGYIYSTDSPELVIDINNQRLNASGGIRFDWLNGLFYNTSAMTTADFDNQILYRYNSGLPLNVEIFNYMSGLMKDDDSVDSIQVFDRLLYGSWGFDSGMTTLIKTPGSSVETNGNWRIGIESDEFVIQRRESGTWNTKFSQSA